MKNIKAIVFDVDGVLTDGSIIIDSSGNEIKSFNVKDGQLISFMQKQGYLFASLSGRSSPALEARLKMLKVDFFCMGCQDKYQDYLQFKETFSLNDDQIIYIGDDIIDLKVIKTAGFSVAPADAIDLVKENVQLITKAKGGKGVLREVIDLIIEKNNLSQALLDQYLK